MDNGRLRALVEPREFGRCCQASVPARDGAIALLGDDLELKEECVVAWGRSWGTLSVIRRLSPFDGVPLKRSNAPLTSAACRVGGGGRLIAEMILSWVGVSVSDLIESGVPAFEGESFVGEMDLARSAQIEQLAPQKVREILDDNFQLC